MTHHTLDQARRAIGATVMVGFHATARSAAGTAVGMEKNGQAPAGLGKNNGPVEER